MIFRVKEPTRSVLTREWRNTNLRPNARAFATHHGLLGLAKRMPSRCQPDDGLGHDDPGRRDGPDDGVHGNRLRRGKSGSSISVPPHDSKSRKCGV
jgi:hypothetical protein